jgi:serine/threonine-protein kinase HipA
MERLTVSWAKELVGYIYQGDNNQLKFEYSDAWLEKGFLPISHSLPTSEKSFGPEESAAFFANLMLEGSSFSQEINKLGFSWPRTPKKPAIIFNYFKEYGLDCAGALSIGPEGWEDKIPVAEYREISNELDKFFNTSVVIRPTLIRALDARLSIAGFQDKVALHKINDKFFLPEYGSNSPTTLIMKNQSREYGFLPENKFFCNNLAERIGLPVPKTDLLEFNKHIVLLSERYDRKITDNSVIRLHQEDFCQALSLMPNKKYESNSGPGFADCFKIIFKSKLDDSKKNLDNFVKTAIYNVIIGNCDAHGKNFSILYNSPVSGKQLSPFYDLVSTKIYVELSEKFSMKYGEKSTLEEFNNNSWSKFASYAEFDLKTLSNKIFEITEQIEA